MVGRERLPESGDKTQAVVRFKLGRSLEDVVERWPRRCSDEWNRRERNVIQRLVGIRHGPSLVE
jgi:hypothetical protein